MTEPDAGWKRLHTGQDYPNSGGFLPDKVAVGWTRAHVACLHSFLTAIGEGTPGEPGLDVGVRIQEIMDAAYASAESGRWVTV